MAVGESKEARGDRKPDRMLRESFQVAGGGDRWRVAGGNEGWSAPAASFRRLMDGTSIPSSIQSSAIDAAIASVAVGAGPMPCKSAKARGGSGWRLAVGRAKMQRETGNQIGC